MATACPEKASEQTSSQPRTPFRKCLQHVYMVVPVPSPVAVVQLQLTQPPLFSHIRRFDAV